MRLTIKLIEGVNLPVGDVFTSDPYCLFQIESGFLF